MECMRSLLIRMYPTLRAVGFSYASRERNHCEQPFDFSSSMCELRHTPRDAFDITSSYFAGNHFTAGSPKRSFYVAERTRRCQNKFTNSFYRFKFNLSALALDGGSLKETNGCSQWFFSREAWKKNNCSQGKCTQESGNNLNMFEL